VKFAPGTRAGDTLGGLPFYFDFYPRNEPDTLFPGFVSCIIKALDGIMIRQGNGLQPLFYRFPDKQGRAQVSVRGI
jgi:hypothetical protein